MGIASLVLGICSIVFTVFSAGCLAGISIVLGIVGTILGAIDLKKKKETGLPNGITKAGLVCSVIGLCISIIALVFYIAVLAASPSSSSSSWPMY